MNEQAYAQAFFQRLQAREELAALRRQIVVQEQVVCCEDLNLELVEAGETRFLSVRGEMIYLGEEEFTTQKHGGFVFVPLLRGVVS